MIKKNEDGFTLVEVMVAILFITIATISLTSLTIGSIVLHDNIETRSRASDAGSMILNQYSSDTQNLPVSIVSGLPKRNGFSWILTPTTITSNQILLTATITWNSRFNKQKSLIMNRLVTTAIGTP